MEIVYNGYLYNSIDYETGIENDYETTLQDAKGLELFLGDCKEWNDSELDNLKTKIKENGLTNLLSQELYKCYYDLCFYGNKTKEWFLTYFEISEKQINKLFI